MDTDANEQWIANCIARVLAIDPDAEVALLTPILEEMAENLRWRNQEPEAVIDKMLGPVTRIRRLDDPDDVELSWWVPLTDDLESGVHAAAR
jgi:hypothetical protein